MRLPMVLNQLNDAVIVIDPRSDRIADANPKACAMLGYSRNELISLGVSAVHPDEIQEFNKFMQSVQAEGSGWTDELRCLTKSGEVLVAEMSASMIIIDGELFMVIIVRPVFESRIYTRHFEVQKDLAIIEERNRLAREIHDTLAQSLTVLVLRLDLVGDVLVSDLATARTELESLKLLAVKCVEEARRSIWDLQPQVLDSSGLVEAVQIETERLCESEIRGEFRVSGAEAVVMDRRLRSAALRVVQAALSNVIKHSKAKTAVVRLDFGSEILCITVTDDGIGFEPRMVQSISPITGGFGITSMRERARLTGGSLNLQSALGQGTTVEVSIPYRSAQPSITVANQLAQPDYI